MAEMNDPKDYTKMQRDTWKKTVEKYREDMLKLAKLNKQVDETAKNKKPTLRPAPLPEPEPPQTPKDDGAQKLQEEQELQKLFERTKQAREELERLEKEKEELEQQLNEQRTQLQTRPFEQDDTNPPHHDEPDDSQIPNDTEFDPIENTQRLPNSIPIPEWEFPLDNSGIILPPPNSGPGEGDNEIIDFRREPGERENDGTQEQTTDTDLLEIQEQTTDEDLFDEPAEGTQEQTDTAEEDAAQPQPPTTTPEGDRIIRPEYGVADVDRPVEQLERTPTSMQMIPRDRFDESQLTGTADLIVQVFTARQALPLVGATVTITQPTEADGESRLIAVHVTDENGKIPPVPLATPPLFLSETPGYSYPYSEYDVDVRKDGYYENIVRGIQMFDGITTVEPVNMIPLPTGQNNGEEQFDIGEYEL